jgi:vacuolar iron transporter family protein
MSRLRAHPERHLVSRIGWLRAAVLGANDGIVSTASLIIGVATASGANFKIARLFKLLDSPACIGVSSELSS